MTVLCVTNHIPTLQNKTIVLPNRNTQYIIASHNLDPEKTTRPDNKTNMTDMQKQWETAGTI